MKTKLFLTAVLIALTLAGLFVFVCPFVSAQNGTNVSGILAPDSTWTQANGPYNLTGNVLVNNGATLTIQPQTTVNFNNYYIRVNGTLIIQPGVTINMLTVYSAIQVYGTLTAIGTSDNPIHINGAIVFNPAQLIDEPTPTGIISFMPSSVGWNDQTSSGSIIQKAIINSTNIQAASDVSLSDNLFLGSRLMLSGGSPTVTGNTISNYIQLGDASATISNNNISGGILVNGYGNAVISNNLINSLSLTGYGGSSLLIENNLIANSPYGGITFSGSSVSNVVIQSNTITNNTYGLYITSAGLPTIANNNIYGNTLNVKLDYTSQDVSLPNNWWGTTDPQAINQSIYDFKNDFNLGAVNFVPYLTSPNANAPPTNFNPVTNPIATPLPTPLPSTSSNESPSQTPITPEYHSIMIVLIVVLFGAAAVLLVGKKRLHERF